MTWQRAPVATALAAMFTAATADQVPPVSCFERPPETLNAPALVCTDPATVGKRTAGMGVDQTEFVVTDVCALELSDDLDALLDVADRAILADPTLGGVVLTSVVTEYRNWRPLQIGGAPFRAADLAIRIDL